MKSYKLVLLFIVFKPEPNAAEVELLVLLWGQLNT